MNQPKGRFWQLDAQGYIQNDADRRYIKPPYAAVIRDAVKAYTDRIAGDLYSIYVTGSVARGLVVEGKSDINLFAVLTNTVDPDLVMQDWVLDAEEALIAEHLCIADAHLELWPHNYVFSDPDRFSIGAFIIKTHSVCLWGSDLAEEIPPYKVSAGIANDDIVQIQEDIEEAIAAINDEESPANVRYWCRNVMKHILRAGFSLVMLPAGRHTRDLDLCAATFSEYHPAHAPTMQQALTYAYQPSGKASEVLRFLDATNDWLLPLAHDWLETHNPERDPALKVDDLAEADE